MAGARPLQKAVQAVHGTCHKLQWEVSPRMHSIQPEQITMGAPSKGETNLKPAVRLKVGSGTQVIAWAKESKPRINSGFWMVDSGIHSNFLPHLSLPWLYLYLPLYSFHTPHYPTQTHGLSNHSTFLLFPLRSSLLSSSHCSDSTSRTLCFMSPIWI